MDTPEKRPMVIERFYQALDEDTAASLSADQKAALEEAVLSITLTTRQRIDIRRTVSFFGRRYFYVFLAGRDRRNATRHKSTFGRMALSVLVFGWLLFCAVSVFITLYLIKSALGIDVFKHFHVGLWTWLIEHQR